MREVNMAIAVDDCANCGEQVALHVYSNPEAGLLTHIWRHTDTGLLDCIYRDGTAEPVGSLV